MIQLPIHIQQQTSQDFTSVQPLQQLALRQIQLSLTAMLQQLSLQAQLHLSVETLSQDFSTQLIHTLTLLFQLQTMQVLPMAQFKFKWITMATTPGLMFQPLGYTQFNRRLLTQARQSHLPRLI